VCCVFDQDKKGYCSKTGKQRSKEKKIQGQSEKQFSFLEDSKVEDLQ